MTTSENGTSVINELIEINNDRVAGFEKAIADIDDQNIDLKELFQGYFFRVTQVKVVNMVRNWQRLLALLMR